ncbi:response regulator [Herbaspirillum sp. GCM10030257]|uniref:hybrid sensor histidine kinase/response regulator n=1 Tax=Herbaspirillum sp. GCM10030257 TaxID=3273393 RepID=UPI00362150E1
MTRPEPVNILLVDDQPANLLALETVLEKLGETLVCASSGEEALRHVLSTNFAVILLDVRMPTMSGFDTARMIRTHPKSNRTPIIFLTAAPDDPNFPVDEAYALGAVDYLTKPIIPTVLQAKVCFFVDLYRKTIDLARIERERHAAALGEKDARIRLLLENLKDYAFVVTDVDGWITEWEGGAEAITGWTARQAIGKPLSMLFTHEDRIAGRPDIEMTEAREHGRCEDKRWHVCKDGSRFYADGVTVALNDAQGALRGFTKIFRDVTGEKRVADNLRRLATDLAETDRRKTEFLATLAHELRNPLAPLQNGLEIMRLSAGNAEVLGRTRDMMERQLTHMVHLVDDLLDVARITRGKVHLKKERVQLKNIVDSAVETSMPLIRASRHQLLVQVAEETMVLDADPTRLAQVVSNLLNNASKYTPAGGRIALTAARDGNQAVIAVTDNGVGIPEDLLPSVFDMFTQVGQNKEQAQGGLGVGLTLVRRLVELHGGAVTASSEGPGCGSTFTVRLPLVLQAPAEPDMSLPIAATIDHTNKRVLVVDDNSDVAESLSALLQVGGYTTRVANDAMQTFEMAQEFKPEVVFLDIGMPGMNGYEVARTLRKTPGMEQVVLVALSGWGSESDRKRSRAAGFDGHLTKPAGLAAVNRLLSRLSWSRNAAHSS